MPQNFRAVQEKRQPLFDPPRNARPTGELQMSDDELLARLIAAIGKSDASHAERSWFEDRFRALKWDYQKRLPAFESDVEHRELLRKFLANGEERRELRRQLKAMEHELWRIRRIRLNATPTFDDESRLILSVLTNPEI